MSSTKRNPFDYRERMKNREKANPLAGRNPADFDNCDPYGNPIRDRYDPLAGRNPGMSSIFVLECCLLVFGVPDGLVKPFHIIFVE